MALKKTLRNRNKAAKKGFTYRFLSESLFYGWVGLIVVALIGLWCKSGGASPIPPSNTKDVYNLMSRSVVMLTNAEGSSGGTGFLVKAKSGNNVVVTNWHVCQIGETSMYARRTAEFRDVKLKVLSVDPKNDLCVLSKVPGEPLQLAPYDTSRFEELYVLGHPLLHELTPIEGRYVGETGGHILFPPLSDGTCPKGLDQQMTVWGPACDNNMTLGDTTVRIYPGNSGSPITDVNGNVVGVINSSSGETSNGGFIPLRFLKRILEKY